MDCVGQMKRETFAFSKLPPEIRNIIYSMCLVYEHPMALEAADPYEWDTSDDTSDDEHSMSTDMSCGDNSVIWRRSTASSQQPTVCTELLCVSKAIHAEASAILYGSNTFELVGDYCWHDLALFSSQLLGRCRQHVRRLNLEFPNIEPFRNGSISTDRLVQAGLLGLDEVRNFHGLETLTMYVYESLGAKVLRTLHEYLKDCCCRVIMDFPPMLTYDDRLVAKISAEAVAEMRSWGWELTGSWAVVESRRERT
ncbi:MAG: hypothetical protein Q9208_006047 [Pyrenodesmia sp. 3 TL-2023]